jgi:hypothetical protein
MWQIIFKKNITKSNMFSNIDANTLQSKLKLINDLKSKKIITNYAFLKILFKPFFHLYGISFIINMYTNFLINLEHLGLKLYQTTILIKLTKKQTFSHIFYKNKLAWFYTNGILLKKLNILKKSQKKDLKISLLNVKNTVNTEIIKNNNNIVVNIVNTKIETQKLSHILRSGLKYKNIIYIYTPLIFFSKNRFKKIQSIKRKLKKRYVV